MLARTCQNTSSLENIHEIKKPTQHSQSETYTFSVHLVQLSKYQSYGG